MDAHWKARAVLDRMQVFDFIETRSEQGAIATDAEIMRAVHLLTDFPQLGHYGRVQGTYEFQVTKQLVLVYRIRPELNRLEILRIMHTRQHFP